MYPSTQILAALSGAYTDTGGWCHIQYTIWPLFAFRVLSANVNMYICLMWSPPSSKITCLCRFYTILRFYNLISRYLWVFNRKYLQYCREATWLSHLFIAASYVVHKYNFFFSLEKLTRLKYHHETTNTHTTKYGRKILSFVQFTDQSISVIGGCREVF